MAPRDSYGLHLLLATGSSEHLEQVLTRFKKQGYKNWSTVRQRLKGSTESTLYRAIGLPYVPPELREGRDELELLAGDYGVRHVMWLDDDLLILASVLALDLAQSRAEEEREAKEEKR